MPLDIDFVRSQFPQAQDRPELAFCASAGGSYVALPVIDQLEYYNRHLRVQPYSAFSPSREAGLAMDSARDRWAAALNVDERELTIGPSTSSNSYVMAQAIGSGWGPDDEIIVTRQDHEANHGVWRRMAESRGATVREWPIDPITGLLDPEALYPMLSARTRWVFFTHCSNVIGTINPVVEIITGIRARSSALVGVDAVAYAPHHICDLRALDVDLYLFSLYKVFGPHQGMMYVRHALQEALAPQCHFFIEDDPHKRFNPTGPQHGQIAACSGVLDYFDLVLAHHGSNAKGSLDKMAAIHRLLEEHETILASALVDYLDNSPCVRLLGKNHCRDGDRVATIAFKPLKQSSETVASALQARNIGTESGHFYAHRLLTAVGIEPAEGVVRLSLVHYNTVEEVNRILRALDEVLD